MNVDIYQITGLLSKQQVITLGLFNDNKGSKKSKYLLFYNLIHEHKITNDEDAMIELNYTNKASFLKFKDRYKRKLLDYLLLAHASVPMNDKTFESYFELLKLYSASRILHLRGNNKNALILYEYINKKSEKLDFLDLLYFTTVYLKRHYAFINPSKKLFKYYSEKIEYCEHHLNRLNYINHHYDEISHNNIVLNQYDMPQFKKSTLETSEELNKQVVNGDTYEFKNKVYEISAYALNLNEEYEESIEVSKKSIQLSNEHYNAVTTKTLAAYKDILTAYLRLHDYPNAQIYLSKILEFAKSINHNYFRYRSLEFTLYANTFAYDKLYELTNETLAKRKIKEYKVHYEEWTIREAFVNILIEAEKIDPSIIVKSKRKFKLSRFINEVEFYSKDKRGTNISILVIQLIHYLIRKDYDKIVDRLDSLNQYTFRYLKNDETLRSNCFIKMLLKLPEAEYHPLRTERYVAKYAKKLAENPFEVSMKEIAIEIIPYEHLWNIILEILNKNLEKKSSKR